MKIIVDHHFLMIGTDVIETEIFVMVDVMIDAILKGAVATEIEVAVKIGVRVVEEIGIQARVIGVTGVEAVMVVDMVITQPVLEVKIGLVDGITGVAQTNGVEVDNNLATITDSGRIMDKDKVPDKIKVVRGIIIGRYVECQLIWQCCIMLSYL